MKINITNAVALNGGDAAILFAEIALLKKTFGEDTEFSIYEKQPQVCRKYYPDLDLNPGAYNQVINSRSKSRLLRFISNRFKLLRFSCGLHLFNKSRALAKILLQKTHYAWLEKYSNADLVLSTGGTYLVEHYGLESRIFESNVALTLGKPLVFFTQSLGPFRSKRNIRCFRQIFRKSLLILVRDALSKKNLAELSVDPSKVILAPDVVFGLPVERRTEMGEMENVHIAISTRHWQAFKTKKEEEGMSNYKASVRDLVVFLVKEYKAKVDFISTCQGIPEYWTDDSKTAMDIYLDLPEHIRPNAHVDKLFHHPLQLKNLYKKYNLVIATRMHAAILSMTAGVPVLAIAYEFKTEELFKELQLEKWVLNIESINANDLILKVKLMLENMDNVLEIMNVNVDRLHRGALETGVKVKEALKSGS